MRRNHQVGEKNFFCDVKKREASFAGADGAGNYFY